MNKFDLGLPKFEDTLFSTEEQRQEARLEKVMKIPISEIHDFKQHPFHVRMDCLLYTSHQKGSAL